MSYVTDEALTELAEHIAARRPDCVLGWGVVHNELTIEAPRDRIVDFLEFLKNDATARQAMLVDITAVDHPEREARFDVVYHLLSMYQNQRLRVKIAVREDEMVPSAVAVHPGANWLERETFDMFGIVFTGHPDMRRILTDYGFRGHPLRKDFPTTGYVQVRYDEEQKRVVYEPVALTQEYRQFDFMSPWEGANYILPGDEKGAK